MLACPLAQILGTVDEAREVVAKARMWRWKPDGEVTLRFAQDARGAPVSLMNDPLHYPHGTKFMAPGAWARDSRAFAHAVACATREVRVGASGGRCASRTCRGGGRRRRFRSLPNDGAER